MMNGARFNLYWKADVFQDVIGNFYQKGTSPLLLLLFFSKLSSAGEPEVFS